jgi:succinate--hydroxymethylglutarate CoA-transferase
VAPVFGVQEALARPFVAETGMVQSAPHPADPSFRVMGSPIRIDGDRGPHAPCPPMGADNQAVLGDLARPAGALAE